MNGPVNGGQRGSWQGGWEEVPDPKIEGPTDVIAKMVSTAICGTDLHILIPPEVEVGRMLGHEGIGVITEVGDGVTHPAAGDRVSVACVSSLGTARTVARASTANVAFTGSNALSARDAAPTGGKAPRAGTRRGMCRGGSVSMRWCWIQPYGPRMSIRSGSPAEIAVDDLPIDACDRGERRLRRTARTWRNVLFMGGSVGLSDSSFARASRGKIDVRITAREDLSVGDLHVDDARIRGILLSEGTWIIEGSNVFVASARHGRQTRRPVEVHRPEGAPVPSVLGCLTTRPPQEKHMVVR